MKLTITLLTSALILVPILPASAAGVRDSGSPSTARAVRNAEKTLLAVSAWKTEHPTTFSDDAARAKLFDLHSNTRRVVTSLSILNAREPIQFFEPYSVFAKELAELRKTVALKGDWAPLLGEVIQASADALEALKNDTAETGPTLAGTSGAADGESVR